MQRLFLRAFVLAACVFTAVEVTVAADELGFQGVWVAGSQSVFRDACAARALCEGWSPALFTFLFARVSC